MNNQEMLRLVDGIARERNLDKEVLYTDIEQAMVSAARKHFNALDTEDFQCELDRMTGKIRLWHEGQEVPLETLGRIPAQTAKQVMIQRFREDERTSIYNEFIDRRGELVTGMAQRYEGGALVVSINRAEAFMPKGEQIPGEQHQPGERVRCIIVDVRETPSQVKIVVSRSDPDFIRRLFEVEVPEVAERVIEIKAMAREPGHRTKIAVSSIDSKVDAVGACVGVRGSRIKNIVDELAGEKIDIVRWNESSQILIANALKPAEVVDISLCFELGRATVVVNEDQLSLAIGKRGQNVRLAARLTNWDIDILTPAEFTRSMDVMEETLRQVEGLEDEQIDRLAALGIISVFDVEEVATNKETDEFDAGYLMEIIDCTEEQAEAMFKAAVERGKLVTEEQQREKEEAEKAKKAKPPAPTAAQAMSVEDLLGGAAAGAPPKPAASTRQPHDDLLLGLDLPASPSQPQDQIPQEPAGEAAREAASETPEAPAAAPGESETVPVDPGAPETPDSVAQEIAQTPDADAGVPPEDEVEKQGVEAPAPASSDTAPLAPLPAEEKSVTEAQVEEEIADDSVPADAEPFPPIGETQKQTEQPQPASEAVPQPEVESESTSESQAQSESPDTREVEPARVGSESSQADEQTQPPTKDRKEEPEA